MASSRIKGITIELNGDTTKLSNALKSVDKDINSVNRELKEVNRLLKFDPSNTEVLSQKQDLLKNAIEQTSEKLRTLKMAKDQAEESGNIDKNSAAYRELEREIVATEQSLSRLSDEQEGVYYEIKKLENFDAFEDLADDVENFADEQEDATGKTSVFAEVLKANLLSQAITSGMKMLVNGAKSIVNAFGEWGAKSDSIKESETKLVTILNNTTDATDEQIQAYIKLTKEKEKNGVVSKDALLSASQEMATYIENIDVLSDMVDVVADMTAQQYGANASMEQATNVATGLGKALANGDYSFLTKLGYGFTEAQKEIMKTGTEAERTAVIMDVVGESIGGVNAALLETDAGKMKAAFAEVEDAQVAIGGAFQSMKAAMIGEFLPSIKEVSGAIQGMLSGDVSIADGMGQIKDAILGGMGKIKEALPQILETGKTVIKEILNGITAMLPDLVIMATEIIDTLIITLVEMLPMLLEMGITLLTSLISGIGNSLPTLIPVIIEMIGLMIETLVQNIPTIISAGADLLAGLIEGIAEALPLLVGMIPQVIFSIFDTLTNPDSLGTIISAAFKILTTLAEGLLRAIPDLLRTVVEIPKKIWDKILETDWLELGKDIINGIIDGLKSMGTGIGNAVKEIGSNILTGFKNFFGIKSPSRLMKEQIGTFLGEGIIEGLDQNFTEGIKGINNKIVNAMKDVTSNINSDVNIDVNKTSSGAVGPNIIINLYAQEVDDEAANRVADKVNRILGGSYG